MYLTENMLCSERDRERERERCGIKSSLRFFTPIFGTFFLVSPRIPSYIFTYTYLKDMEAKVSQNVRPVLVLIALCRHLSPPN
jgi:hypothetical protein